MRMRLTIRIDAGRPHFRCMTGPTARFALLTKGRVASGDLPTSVGRILGTAKCTLDVHSTENETNCGNSPDSFRTRPTCTKQAPCPHVTSLGWLGRSGGKCVKAVNMEWSYRTRPAGQLVFPHPLGRQQILQEGSVRVTNLSGGKGLDTTSGGESLVVYSAGGIMHAGRLRAATRGSILRAHRSVSVTRRRAATRKL